MIDLHTHSSFSDGSDTPTQLAQKAHDIGLTAISLTDHDTTLSHEEMALACERLGVELVTGVEVSLREGEFPTTRDGHAGPRSIHVLGYFLPLEPTHPLQLKLAELRGDRETRNELLVRTLQDLGFERLNFDYLIGLAGKRESIGRPHFARAMFELHPEIVGERTDESWNRLFIEWLGTGGRAYIPKTSIPLEDFIDSASGSGAVFSIAHPLVNYLETVTPSAIERTMPKVMASLRERGVLGIEAYYGSTDAHLRALMVKLTRDAGMIPTGGSDYHGTYKEDIALGLGLSGDLRVPDEVLDELKAARNS
ncbi:MAG: PHP domain-containing protein [Acidimicrobiaceae bacterium]|nr:PHP domain-containing protein [Acidimicrobiaceae bacterium]